MAIKSRKLAVMNFTALSDKAIQVALGERFQSLRLRHNITQQELATATALSLGTIKSLEAGKGKISTVIAVLREFNALDSLQHFIPEPGISPIQLAKMKGKTRQRASGERQKKPVQDEPEW